MEASPTKDQLPATTATRKNLLRRKPNISTMAMPTLLILYFLGACLAFMVCTRTFVSFHIFSQAEESQSPVQLPGQEERLPSESAGLEITEQITQSRRDVRIVADNSWRYIAVAGSLGEVEDHGDSDEPEFMQQPLLRMDSANSKAADLEARLKRMTSWERRRWLAEHWSSFQILKEDYLSRQFQHRMQRFFCAAGDRDSSPPANVVGHTAAAASSDVVDQMEDETKICGRRVEQPGSGRPPPTKFRLCRQRFILTWMSPVISFGPRERLSVESIFKWHPHACVVILSRTMDSSAGRKLLEPFVKSGYRVTAVTPDLQWLFSATPAAQWFTHLRDGMGDPGCINLMQNLSNVMRLAALYKYGGIYLDTDVIVLKPMDGLRNAVGTQSHDAVKGRWTRLNNAVLVFQREHPVVLAFVKEFAETFHGSRWGWNGPYLVSRVLEKELQLQTAAEPKANCSTTSRSSAVSVLPRQAFYPVNWIDIVRFFQHPANACEVHWQAAELEWMRQGSYAIHLWNKKSNFLKVDEGSIMETLFKHSCLFCYVSRS